MWDCGEADWGRLGLGESQQEGKWPEQTKSLDVLCRLLLTASERWGVEPEAQLAWLKIGGFGACGMLWTYVCGEKMKAERLVWTSKSLDHRLCETLYAKRAGGKGQLDTE